MNICIEDLFYLYGSRGEAFAALRGLHLNIASGECLVIKGPNGSGKSTLVKLLTGFLTPSAGRILINGMNLSQIDPLRLRREYISSIEQQGNLLPDLTIQENIALAFTFIGESHSNSKTLSRDLLREHGFGHLTDRYETQLSAGERQLCSLLAAMATNPKILIADEPSGELDDAAAQTMYAMLKSLSGNTTVILVTHDSRAEAFGDQVVRIQDGRISEQWRHGEDERSVIDPFGWMRVRDSRRQFPIKPAAALQGLATEESTRLRTNGLSVTYGDMNLFANFDLQGAAGELIALSSRSGSGKSTLLRILGGMQNPTDGTISIGETFLTELNREDRAELRREFIGYLSQGDSAISNLSLSDYLGDARPTLEMDFGSRMKRPMSNFSGGERAWIQLQKLLSKPKPILLLDEPTSQMDERRSYQVAQLLIDFVSAGGLVVTSTRDHTLLESANRVISLTSA